MIIGKGDIASALNDREGALFFASGISNSTKFDGVDKQREYDLLYFQNRELCCFYFSTISIYTTNTPYTRHKLKMEELVKRWFENYNIIRIGNIDWGNNPNTFLNNLKTRIANGEPVKIRDEYKYMISQEQLRLITDNLPLTGQNEINVFGYMDKVENLLK